MYGDVKNNDRAVVCFTLEFSNPTAYLICYMMTLEKAQPQQLNIYLLYFFLPYYSTTVMYLKIPKSRWYMFS
jgi:hypothetical protein